MDDVVVRLFLESVTQAIDESDARFGVIASADFSHTGPMYGLPKPIDLAAQDVLRTEDAALIDSIAKVDPEGFWAQIAQSNNKNNVCGVAPIYCTLKIAQHLACRTGSLLSYEQAVDDETRSCVSFAALALAPGADAAGTGAAGT